MMCQFCADEVATRTITVADRAGHILAKLWACPEHAEEVINSADEEVYSDVEEDG